MPDWNDITVMKSIPSDSWDLSRRCRCNLLPRENEDSLKMVFLLKPLWTVFLAQGLTSGRTGRCWLSGRKNGAAERQRSRRELSLCAGPGAGYVNALRPPEMVQ